MEQLKNEIYANVNQQVDEKLDKTEKKLTKKMNSIKMENDAKIESLRELVQGSHENTNNKLDMLLQHLVPQTIKPPRVQVEQDGSPRWGSQK